MRSFLKALLAAAAFAVVVAFLGLCWFYFYSGDLPYFAELTQLAPDSDTTILDHCSSTPIRVISSASLGKNLGNALRAAEGSNDEILAFQVSRKLFCNSAIRIGQRHLLEYKAAVQIRRKFTPEQLVTIYLNQADFGEYLVGAENASLHFYGKHASDLEIQQAAMVAGLLKSPNLYSPNVTLRERRNVEITLFRGCSGGALFLLTRPQLLNRVPFGDVGFLPADEIQAIAVLQSGTGEYYLGARANSRIWFKYPT